MNFHSLPPFLLFFYITILFHIVRLLYTNMHNIHNTYVLIYCILQGILCYITLYYVKPWTNLFHRARFFGSAVLFARPIRQAKKRMHETKVCLQLRNNCKYSFLLFVTQIGLVAFIFNVLPLKVFAMRFLQSECCFNIRNKMPLKRIIFIIQTQPPKGVQMNMLKAWNLIKNKLFYRCFDKILLSHVLSFIGSSFVEINLYKLNGLLTVLTIHTKVVETTWSQSVDHQALFPPNMTMPYFSEILMQELMMRS